MKTCPPHAKRCSICSGDLEWRAGSTNYHCFCTTSPEAPDSRGPSVYRDRARMKKWLRPLVGKPFAEILVLIDSYGKRELQALLAAMESASPTNCWWVVYQFARLVAPYVRDRLCVYEKTRD